jgi:hypothetical protein
MERKFYDENFESSLKEHADEFKMYPSKKVWHGIYNSVHPGRRWPSAAISILFIFTLVIIGHLNTGNPPGSVSKVIPGKEITSTLEKETNRTPTGKKSEPYQRLAKDHTASSVVSTFNNSQSINPGTVTVSGEVKNIENATLNNETIPATPSSLIKENVAKETVALNQHEPGLPALQTTGVKAENVSAEEDANNEHFFHKILNEPSAAILADILLPVSKKPLPLSEEITTNKKTTEEINLQAEALNRSRARKNKLSWTFFVTPSLSYRTYSRMDKSVASNLALNPMTNTNKDENAIERPSLGLLGGTSVNYNITKKLKLIAGTRLGYSEFDKKASHVHPTIASLVLINSVTGDPYTLTSFSNYGNMTGAAELSLHNYSLQVSTPIGFQYTIGGNDDMKLDLLSTFQPTYVIASHAYLLSSNNKNFISEPSLSRKWNMGVTFGTLLSFGSGGYKWQVGPNVDYQILSTYDSRYPIKEHLINYGVRLGVTKIRR